MTAVRHRILEAFSVTLVRRKECCVFKMLLCYVSESEMIVLI